MARRVIATKLRSKLLAQPDMFDRFFIQRILGPEGSAWLRFAVFGSEQIDACRSGIIAPMADYLVLDVNEFDGTVALLDSLGAYHVAYLLGDIPAMGTFLQCACAANGESVLASEAEGRVYRVIFAAVDCGQDTTFEMLHMSTQGVARRDTPASPASNPFARRQTEASVAAS